MANRKDFELMTPTRAAKALGVHRGTVIYRIAKRRYDTEQIGGVTFVVANDALLSDIEAASALLAAG